MKARSNASSKKNLGPVAKTPSSSKSHAAVSKSFPRISKSKGSIKSGTKVKARSNASNKKNLGPVAKTSISKKSASKASPSMQMGVTKGSDKSGTEVKSQSASRKRNLDPVAKSSNSQKKLTSKNETKNKSIVRGGSKSGRSQSKFHDVVKVVKLASHRNDSAPRNRKSMGGGGAYISNAGSPSGGGGGPPPSSPAPTSMNKAQDDPAPSTTEKSSKPPEHSKKPSEQSPATPETSKVSPKSSHSIKEDGAEGVKPHSSKLSDKRDKELNPEPKMDSGTSATRDQAQVTKESKSKTLEHIKRITSSPPDFQNSNAPLLQLAKTTASKLGKSVNDTRRIRGNQVPEKQKEDTEEKTSGGTAKSVEVTVEIEKGKPTVATVSQSGEHSPKHNQNLPENTASTIGVGKKLEVSNLPVEIKMNPKKDPATPNSPSKEDDIKIKVSTDEKSKNKSEN